MQSQYIPIRRSWANASRDTFNIKPISDLLDRWLYGRRVIVDPFARNSKRATITNDLDPDTTAQHHDDAEKWLCRLAQNDKVVADAVLIDPPYSPRQIKECYRNIGRECGTADTQNARLYRAVKDLATQIVVTGGVAICCGWSGVGFGKRRGFELREMLVVTHGSGHNATIVTVEEKMPNLFTLGAAWVPHDTNPYP